MARKVHVRKYRARNGATQHKPSIELLSRLESNCRGFCLACGSRDTPAEPDARRYACDDCGADKVYGAGELALMGLCF